VIAARGSNLARLYYSQRFDEGFDQAVFQELKPDNEIKRILHSLYKITWAMHKAENYYLRKSTPDYEQWKVWLINSGFDISECIDDLLAEITEGFSVTRAYGKDKGQRGDYGRNLPQKIISVALKMGMTLDEINEMTTQTLIDIMHEYVSEGKKEETRMATPAEASAYFGGAGFAGNTNKHKKLRGNKDRRSGL